MAQQKMKLKPGDSFILKDMDDGQYHEVCRAMMRDGASRGEYPYKGGGRKYKWLVWSSVCGNEIIHNGWAGRDGRELSYDDVFAEEPITLRPGDYVSTKGMTDEQYHAVARAFMAAGAQKSSQILPWNQWKMLGWCEQDGLYHSDSSFAYYGEKRHLTPAQVIGATNAGGKTQDTLTGALKYACDELDTARQHESKAAEHRANHDGAMEHVRDMLPDGWRLVRDEYAVQTLLEDDGPWSKGSTSIGENLTDAFVRGFCADRPTNVDLTDPENWREGDVVECVDDKPDHCHEGILYTVNRGAEGDRLSIKADDDGDAGIPPLASFRFHSRPTI